MCPVDLEKIPFATKRVPVLVLSGVRVVFCGGQRYINAVLQVYLITLHTLSGVVRNGWRAESHRLHAHGQRRGRLLAMRR